MKAASLLKQDKIEPDFFDVLPGSGSFVAEVNPRLCSACGECVAVCPFEACGIEEMNGSAVNRVNPIQCRGCGACVAVCPNNAIQIPEHNAYVMAEKVRVAFEKDPPLLLKRANTEDLGKDRASPKVVVFACKWCGLIGADGAGKRRMVLPASFRVIPLECAAQVETNLILTALKDGVDGVAVLGCHQGGCRYHHANHLAARRLDMFRKFLDFIGVGGNRLLLSWGEAHEAHQFAQVLKDFMQSLAESPPCPYRKALRRHVP
jgi:F420-non-reducing hydrogenase iron-sulfur subunit